LGGHVDALALAAVFEVADVLGVGGVQCLALEQRREPRLRFAPAPRRLLLLALGLQALLLLALGADGIGLGQVDLAGRTRLARARLARTALRLGARAARRTALPRAAGIGLAPVAGLLGGGGGLEAQSQQLVAEGIAHGASV